MYYQHVALIINILGFANLDVNNVMSVAKID
jgi:hypothetical protein